MTGTQERGEGTDDGALLALFRAIASHDDREVAKRLGASIGLATRPIRIGASRDYPKQYFLSTIHHYVYSGDTALFVNTGGYIDYFNGYAFSSLAPPFWSVVYSPTEAQIADAAC